MTAPKRHKATTEPPRRRNDHRHNDGITKKGEKPAIKRDILSSRGREVAVRELQLRSSMNRFRDDPFGDSDSSDDDIPPPSGFSQNSQRHRLLIIEDPSSDEDSAQSTFEAADEDEDSNLPSAFERLVMSSRSPSPPLSRDSEIDPKSFHKDSSADAHVNHFLIDSSLEQEADNTSVEQDSDGSTVVQEGRIKTPKPKPPMNDDCDSLVDSSFERDDGRTVVQEGRTKTPNRQPPAEPDYDSLDDSTLGSHDERTVVQDRRIETAKVQEPHGAKLWFRRR